MNTIKQLNFIKMEQRTNNAIQPASVPTTLPGSPVSLQVEVYATDKPLVPADLTPIGIGIATEQFRSAEDSVMVKYGKAYVPSIDRCLKELGQPKVEAMLKMYLIRLNVTTNAAHPMTEAMIDGTVPTLLNHIIKDLLVTINLADLRIIFDRATTGYYGKPYGGYTSQDICGWFDQYQQEKIDAIDRVEQSRKGEELRAFANSNHSEYAKLEKAAMRAAHAQYIKEQEAKKPRITEPLNKIEP